MVAAGLRKLTALDARVAQDFGGLHAIITSPNASDVPQFPHIAGRWIVTRKDGFWGPQEYSRWPQQYHPDVVHHMCIPRPPASADGEGPGPRIWSPLQPWEFDRPNDVWPHEYGYVPPPIRAELR